MHLVAVRASETVTLSRIIPEAVSEPIATVTIQSKLFIYDVDLFPMMRMAATTNTYMMGAAIQILIIPSQPSNKAESKSIYSP